MGEATGRQDSWRKSRSAASPLPTSGAGSAERVRREVAAWANASASVLVPALSRWLTRLIRSVAHRVRRRAEREAGTLHRENRLAHRWRPSGSAILPSEP